MTLLRLTLVSSLALLTATPSYAQAVIDQAGADELSQKITQALESLSPAPAPLKEAVKAMPEGDHYSVTLQFNPMVDSEASLNFAPLTLKLTPQGNGAYAYSGSIPNPMVTITAPKGEAMLFVNAEGQKIEGVWDLEHRVVMQDHSSLTNIQLTDNAGANLMSIGSLSNRLESSFTADGKLDTVIVMALRNMKASEGSGFTLSLDGLGLAGRSFGADIAAIQALRDKMQQNLKDASRPEEVMTSLTDNIKEIFGASGQSDGAFVINNLNVHVDDAETGPVDVKLPLLKASISTMEAEALSIDYQHKGLQVAPLPSPLVADLLPKDTQFNLLISHIPYAKLMDSFSLLLDESNKILQEEEAAKQQPAHKGEPENAGSKMATSSFMDQVVAMKATFIEAGTTFDIKALNVKANSLSLTSSGNFKMINSPLAVAGNYTAHVNGLSELVESLSKQAAAPAASDKPQPQENPVDQGALMFLGMAQAMGEPVTGSHPSTLIYSIDLTPEGALKLNGNDLGLLAPSPAVPEGAPETAPEAVPMHK